MTILLLTSIGADEDRRPGRVEAIASPALEGRLVPWQLQGVEPLPIDELAFQGGHWYVKVIVNAPTHQVLWVVRRRERANVRPFSEPDGLAG